MTQVPRRRAMSSSYEALRGTIDEKAAASIAEVAPAAADLATKSDLAGRRSEIRAAFAQLETLRWMLGLFCRSGSDRGPHPWCSLGPSSTTA